MVPAGDDEGAAPEAAAATPQRAGSERPLLQRRPSRRVQDVQEVQRRLREAAFNTVRARLQRLRPLFLIVLFLLLLAACIGMCVFVKDIYATFVTSSLPCDQPLAWYLPGVIAIGCWSNQMKQGVVLPLMARLTVTARWGVGTRSLVAGVPCAIPGWLWLFYGFWMVQGCKTCQQTNPLLYYTTQEYLYVQLILCGLMLLFFVFFACGVQMVHRILSISTGGCEAEVAKLPKVPPDSAELLDEVDNRMKDCPICMVSLASGKAVVRTRCEHFFHEECLATWCKGHVDCPLCRGAIVELDPETGLPVQQ